MTQAMSPPLPSAELIAQKKNLVPPVPADEDNKRIKRRQRRAKSIPSDMADYIKQLQLPLDITTNNFGPLSHLIWVPAHKHPQIAPSEFAAWIKTYHHSNESLEHTNHKLGRKKSSLSHSYTLDELVETKENNDTPRRAYVFDRYSSTDDDSPVLVPRESRSLSRRSALSSRSSDGRRRRSLTGIESNSSKKSNEEYEIPPGGITLYDRPVTMSEWVDLGHESLRDDFVSRIQDQAWAKAPPPPPPPHAEFTNFPPPPSLLTPPIPLPPPPPEPPAEPRKRRKSFKQSVKRKKSWIAGLFQQQSAEQPQPSDNNNKKKDEKKGFGSLISRSLSLSGKKKKTQQQAQPIHNNVRAASEPLLLPGHHRLPIHTERAIYRLSHIKLSNPRRPLLQQVLISNFMFWYISIQQYPFYYYQRQQLPPPPVPPPHQYGQHDAPL